MFPSPACEYIVMAHRKSRRYAHGRLPQLRLPGPYGYLTSTDGVKVSLRCADPNFQKVGAPNYVVTQWSHHQRHAVAQNTPGRRRRKRLAGGEEKRQYLVPEGHNARVTYNVRARLQM